MHVVLINKINISKLIENVLNIFSIKDDVKVLATLLLNSTHVVDFSSTNFLFLRECTLSQLMKTELPQTTPEKSADSRHSDHAMPAGPGKCGLCFFYCGDF